MSVPISASRSWAAVVPMPGILSSWAIWADSGAVACSIRVVRVAIWVVSASIRSSIMPSMKAWCAVKCPVSASCKTLVLARMFR